jgi:hypothetical protein
MRRASRRWRRACGRWWSCAWAACRRFRPRARCSLRSRASARSTPAPSLASASRCTPPSSPCCPSSRRCAPAHACRPRMHRCRAAHACRRCVQSNPARGQAEASFRRRLLIVAHLLRCLAAHPGTSALSGPSYDFDAGAPGPRTTLSRALLAIATHERALPPSCLDSALSALLQLVIGFPADTNDLSEQVRRCSLAVLWACWERTARFAPPHTPCSAGHSGAAAAPARHRARVRRAQDPLAAWRAGTQRGAAHGGCRGRQLRRLGRPRHGAHACIMRAAMHHAHTGSTSAAHAARKLRMRSQAEVAVVNGMNEGVSNAGAIIQSLWGDAGCSDSGLASALLYPGPPPHTLAAQRTFDAVQQARPASTHAHAPMHALQTCACACRPLRCAWRVRRCWTSCSAQAPLRRGCTCPPRWRLR